MMNQSGKQARMSAICQGDLNSSPLSAIVPFARRQNLLAYNLASTILSLHILLTSCSGNTRELTGQTELAYPICNPSKSAVDQDTGHPPASDHVFAKLKAQVPNCRYDTNRERMSDGRACDVGAKRSCPCSSERKLRKVRNP